MPAFFDTHCHFDFAEFNADRELIWADCQQAGVEHLLIPGVEPEQWQLVARMLVDYPGIVMAAGLHPWWVKSHSLPEKDSWLATLENSACVAIGECGLDACIETPLDAQLPVFETHLQMAYEYRLPLIIHVRKTHNETIALLKKYQLVKGGVIHGFTGSLEVAKEYWGLGFRLGVGGSITYPRARKTRETVQAMPLESILLETDAPDMPLSGYQGQANSPLRLPEVAAVLAALRDMPLEQVAKVTTENARKLFLS